MKATEAPTTGIIAEINRLAAKGWGYEDISVELKLNMEWVRPFVIGRKK
jgi:hypothetical protein